MGKDFDIPKLAEAFGSKLTVAIDAAGAALEFAIRHAHALKVVLESLAGLQMAKIAIPVIADLAGGGISQAGAGIAKLFLSFAGLSKVLPALAQFAGFLKTAIWMVGSLAAEEGLASAAGYAFSTAVAAVGGPVTIALAAVAGLIVLMYRFRDATFNLNGTTYQLRDTWNAAWIIMGNVFTWVGDRFHKVVDFMKSVWNGFMKALSDNIILQIFKKAFTAVLELARKLLGALVPQFVVDALNQAKAERLAPEKPPEEKKGPPRPTLPPPETAGLGAPKKEKKDIYGNEIQKLVGLVLAQKAYLNVLDALPEKIAAVAAAEKAQAVILALNTKLIDDKRPALTNAQKATILYLVALEESTKAMYEYGKELVGQQRSTDLSIQQTRTLAAANLLGADAVRAATVENAILGLTYNRTAEQLKTMAPELDILNRLLNQKQTSDLVESTNKEIYALGQEIETRKIAVDSAGQFVEVQRQAALTVKLYSLNQQIATATDWEAIAALKQKKQMIIDLTKAEWSEEDARASIALRSPTERYQEEINQLNREIAAMKTAQGGNLTYAQSLQIAMRTQDAFNRATDETVAVLLRFGGAREGVTAFFLDMQKSAKSTASIVFEALNSAFDKLASNLTELVTGGKTSFGKMFQDIGKQMVNSTIKQELQKGIGALAGKLGINLGGALAGKPDGTQANPLWVRMAQDAGLDPAGNPSGLAGAAAGVGAGSGGLGGLLSGILGGGKGLGGLFSGILGKAAGFLGPLFKGIFGGAAGGMGGIFSALLKGVSGAFAGGGEMSPDKAYLVGEAGPEILSGNTISSNSASRRMLDTKSSTVYYTIDARGTDPAQTEERVRRALIVVHGSAVSTSIQATVDLQKRTPQK